jgi:hypothetical protein
MTVDDNVLVCVRCVELAEPVKGSRQARCFMCDQPVWVGPKSLSEGPFSMPVVCTSCVSKVHIVNKERNAL